MAHGCHPMSCPWSENIWGARILEDNSPVCRTCPMLKGTLAKIQGKNPSCPVAEWAGTLWGNTGFLVPGCTHRSARPDSSKHSWVATLNHCSVNEKVPDDFNGLYAICQAKCCMAWSALFLPLFCSDWGSVTPSASWNLQKKEKNKKKLIFYVF